MAKKVQKYDKNDEQAKNDSFISINSLPFFAVKVKIYLLKFKMNVYAFLTASKIVSLLVRYLLL